jgi:hypothetical protein
VVWEIEKTAAACSHHFICRSVARLASLTRTAHTISHYMGASQAVERAPTHDAQDSEYFTAEGTRPGTLVNTRELLLSYLPLYEAYLQRVLNACSKEAGLEFTGSVSGSPRNGCCPSVKLRVLMRLSQTGLNKILNAFCKAGRFHSDLKVRLTRELTLTPEAQQLITSAFSTENQPDKEVASVFLSFSFDDFSVGMGLVGTHSLRLQLRDADFTSADFIEPSSQIVATSK